MVFGSTLGLMYEDHSQIRSAKAVHPELAHGRLYVVTAQGPGAVDETCGDGVTPRAIHLFLSALIVKPMSDDQTSNTRSKSRLLGLLTHLNPRRRRGDKAVHDDRIELMLPLQNLHRTRSPPSLHAPFKDRCIELPPETPDIVRANPSFFEGAHHFRVENFQFFNANHVTVTPLPNVVESLDGWRLLVEKIAPNALHDSDARYDAPKCDEDTRFEVIGDLMDWIGDRDSAQRLLCMTGAAGSGKSALQQTITELCANLGILGSAFFFSSADPTRNSVSTVVPTIAFQVGSHNPDLKQLISAIVAENPVIFERSLRTQMDSLLVRPMKHLQERAGLDLATLPHAILIDSLDECKGEDRQTELLTAIRESLLTND
ncbi:hypothetical protein EST38_g11147, partial [Candolleomyces aberdarensis]